MEKVVNTIKNDALNRLLTRPCLQLAVDTESLDEGLTLVEKVYPNFDIVEVGTPLIIAEGVQAVEAIKTRWPDKLCLADVKIMDAGLMEADIAFNAGADIVTVLGCSDDSTISGVVESARKHGKIVMADMINCADITGRAKQLEALGVNILCAHASVDSANDADSLFVEITSTRMAVDCPLAIAGGVNQETLLDAVMAGASIVVVGSAISRANSPSQTAAEIMGDLSEMGASALERPCPISDTQAPNASDIMWMVSREISNCTSLIDPGSVTAVLDEIDKAQSIFCGAAGRSGMAIKGFAMRLMHSGRSAHVLGDVTTPSICSGDLLLIGSGSGSTGSLVNAAKKAKSIGARIALITIDPDSPIGEMADVVVKIPAPSPKAKTAAGAVESNQPMGSLFEQSMNILLDSLVVMLMHRHNLTSEAMFKRHANLE
jgi:3-hexulose-6-phosphate synthase/6-phospho-3-hexuloisomerase